MGDMEPFAGRAVEQLSLTVFRLRNMRGTRGETVSVQVKAEYNDRPLGESARVEYSGETTPATTDAEGKDTPQNVDGELNFTSQIPVHFDDPSNIDDVAHKPVLLTFIEVIPKEKKQKEEKTVVLGQCAIDLLPMLEVDTTVHKTTLVIHPVPGSPLEGLQPDTPKPEVDIQLMTSDPLLTSEAVQKTALMNFTVESIYSPPDSWQTGGAQYVYAASTPIPVNSEKEATMVFSNGVLRPGIDKEIPNKQKRWANPGISALGNTQYIPSSLVSAEEMENEDGDYKEKEDKEHRHVAEQDKSRATWNTERRTFLTQNSIKAFQEKIAKNRLWPVEVMRLPMPAANKGKKEDESPISFHGVAYVNLAPLLYPGVKRIKGAYKIYPYTDHDFYEKVKRKHGTADEAYKTVYNQMNRGAASPFPKKGGKDDKKADAKKTSAQGKTDSGSDDVPVAQTNAEGQQYADSKSYLTLEICLSRPMVPKRPKEELAKRVAEYIPPRPLFPKRTNGAEKAVTDYHGQIASVANLVLAEYRNLYGTGAAVPQDQNHASAETKRQKLIYALNSTGKYFAFKEQLKHLVIKIVREKYLRTTAFTSQQELQAFISELYVYLVDQMHVALSGVLSVDDRTPAPPPQADTAQLKHFAKEAETNEDYPLAAKYYQERIAREKGSADHWVDYGVYCLHVNDIAKAEECFKECVSIDQSHLQGLVLYGVVCMMQERMEAAETFFEAATCVRPNSVIAWTMIAMFYDSVGNDICCEMALLEANRCNVESMKSPSKQPSGDAAKGKASEVQDSHVKPPSPTGKGLAATESGKNAMKSNHASKKGSAVGGTLDSRTRSQESVNSARPPSQSKIVTGVTPTPTAEAASAPNVAAADAPGASGATGESSGTAMAANPKETSSRDQSSPVTPRTIYIQVAEWLLEMKALLFAEKALGKHLLCKEGGESVEYHLTMAKLHLLKKDFETTEEQLNNTLGLDYQNPDAWALLGHLKYLTRDSAEAKSCFERTLDFVNRPSETHSICLRLASIYLEEGRFTSAKEIFLTACRDSPSCVSWLGVGMACYRLNMLDEAEDALAEANILSNSEAEVWAYLSLVCLRTNRPLEAEQAYKYAQKLHLKDDELLEEIHGVQESVGFGNPSL